MRSSLRWLLFGTVLLSALAWWWPDDVSRAITPPSLPTAMTAASSFSPTNTAVESRLLPLPERLPSPALESTGFDPFAGVPPPAPPPPKPVAAPSPVAPPLPTPPALNYRYLGQMTDPLGNKLHYLIKADKDVPVTVGTRLDEGYVVQAITADLISLHYAPLDARVDIRIPPAKDSSPAP